MLAEFRVLFLHRHVATQRIGIRDIARVFQRLNAQDHLLHGLRRNLRGDGIIDATGNVTVRAGGLDGE